MGCTLSPDKAKLLLNSIVAAIMLSARGVKCWGWGDAAQEDTWKQISQVAFADDWCGSFTSAAEARYAWALWKAWEPITGSQLGVQKLKKTVLSGVDWDGSGKAIALPDLELEMADGTKVPFMPPWEAYKHLGLWRRADGDEGTAWHQLKKHFNVALAKLRKFSAKQFSMDEFVLVSDAYLGGLGEYYLRTLYIPKEELDKVEAAWRRIYNSKCDRMRSSPRTQLYGSGAAGRGRRHLWETQMTALFDSMTTAMSDTHESAQSMAARSAVARAAAEWGCVGDPLKWQYSHLLDAMEKHLKESSTRDLGLAWWVVVGRLNGAAGEEKGKSCKGELRAWEALQRGDPLRADASHFRAPKTDMLFEPVETGGLGVPVEGVLIRSGCIAVEDMCGAGEGGELGWLPVYGEGGGETALEVHESLEGTREVEEAWGRVTAWLERAGIEPKAGRQRRKSAMELGRRGNDWRKDEDLEAATAKMEAATREVVAELANGAMTRTVEEWRHVWREAAGAEISKEPVAWDNGSADATELARGARVIWDLDSGISASGGQAGWMQRADVDEQGHLADWRESMTRFQRSLYVDAKAFLCWELRRWRGASEKECRVTPEAAESSLPPALRIMVEARWRLEEAAGAEGYDVVDAPIEKGEEGKKFLNARCVRQEFIWLSRYQAQYNLEAVITVDASYITMTDPATGASWKVGARAAAWHDGTSADAQIVEDEGCDNYLGELAAQLDALTAEEPGRRIMIVFDATSPVRAMQRFREAGARMRQRCHVGSWLQHFDRLTRRQELVVFKWQTSHVGSVVNEWADVLAGQSALQGEWRAVPRGPVTYEDFHWTAAKKGGNHAWAARAASNAVSGWLDSAVEESVLRKKDRTRLAALPGKLKKWSDRIAGARAQVGDKRVRRELGRRCTDGDVACPFGCVEHEPIPGRYGPVGRPRPFTWLHAQCYCCGATEVVEARDKWDGTLDKVSQLTEGDHEQVEAARDLLMTFEDRDSDLAKRQVRLLQELLGDNIFAGASQQKKKEKGTGEAANRGKAGKREVKKALWEAVVAGLEVQEATVRATKALTSRIKTLVYGRGRKAKILTAWRQVVVRRGPARATVLARIEVARAVAFQAAEDCGGVRRWVGPEGELREEDITEEEMRRRAAASAASLRASAGTMLATRPVAMWWIKVWMVRWKMLAGGMRTCRRKAQGLGIRRVLRDWMRNAGIHRRILRAARTDVASRTTAEVARVTGDATGLQWLVPWSVGGMGGHRNQEGGVWEAVPLWNEMRTAWRAWTLMGGNEAMSAEEGKERGVQETRRAATLVAHLRQKGRAIPAAIAALSNARMRLGRCVSVERRHLFNYEVANGLRPDGRQRWAVDTLLEWRGSGVTREALVRWLGFDPVTGEEWADNWRPITSLTSDLRAEGRVRKRRSQAEIEEAERVQREESRQGEKRSRRVAGEGVEYELDLDLRGML